MYLRKLYKYNKSLFGFVLCFVIIQLFLNIKRGVTATPFLHYGMYSSRFSIPDTAHVWEVEVNGKPLELSNYSAKVADYIIVPVSTFASLDVSGKSLYDNTIKRILSGLKIPSHYQQFDPAISKQSFENWYKQHLSNLLHEKIDSVKVYDNTCTLNGAQLIVTHKQLFLYAAD